MNIYPVAVFRARISMRHKLTDIAAEHEILWPYTCVRTYVYIYLHIHTLCKSHTCIYPHIYTLCLPNIRVFTYPAYTYVYNCRKRKSASACVYAWIYIHICLCTLVYITKNASVRSSVFLCMHICTYIGGYFYHCRLLRCHLWLLGDSGLKDAVRDCHSHRKGMAASVPLRFIIGLQRFVIAAVTRKDTWTPALWLCVWNDSFISMTHAKAG